MNDLLYLDDLQEKIYSDKTREYFTEVLSSFNNGNYRSATVMLWSVIVFDLLNKLTLLKDVYDDKKAKAILEEIQKLQEQDSKSSSWEYVLVVRVFKDTNLIDKIELDNINLIHQQRHLSAHPAIKENLELYKPSKELVRAMIRIALEALLIRQPIYIDKMLKNIITDLADNKNILTTRKEMSVFTNNKYIKRVGEKERVELFKTFWKFIFNLDNKECNENRFVNTLFLSNLFETYYSELKEYISNNKDYFSQIRNDKNIHKNLGHFLNLFPEIYSLLNDDVKFRLKTFLENDKEEILYSYFIYGKFDTYYEKLEELVKCKELLNEYSGGWKRLFELTKDYLGNNKRAILLLNKFYSSSPDFNSADNRFTIIRSVIQEYTLDDLKDLLHKSDSNSHTHGRNKAISDYKFLKTVIDKLDTNFDYSKYPNFEYNLNL